MPGVELASAYVSLVVSADKIARGVNREFDQIERSADATGKRAGGRLGSGLKAGLAGLAAAAGTGLLVAGFKDVIGRASELEQSVGGVKAVFGDYAAEVDRASKGAAKSVGLTRNEYNELVTVLGAGLKNKGLDDFGKQAQNLVGIGADLAAQYGGSSKEAVEALASAMRGESDPIERYGVSLNETAVNAVLAANGQDKLEGAALEQAKTMARLQIITEQTKDAQGAFAREGDTLAGKQARLSATWDNMKTSLGQQLLPVMTQGLGVVSSFVDGMASGEGAGGRFRDVIDRIWTIGKAAFGELTGGIAAFRAAWKANDGDVTSSGFPGFMERLANIARTVWGELSGGIKAFAAAWKYNDGEITSSGFPGFLERVGFIARQVFGFLRDEAVPALAAVGGFITERLWPDIKAAFIDRIFPAVRELGRVIEAVWSNVIHPALSALWTFIKTVLAPLIVDLYENGVKPTFDLIGQAISGAWSNVIKPTFRWLKDALGGVRDRFVSTKDDVVKAWGLIRDAISSGWDTVNGIFKRFKDGLGSLWDKVGKVKDGIVSVWRGIGVAFSGPINDVIKAINGFLSTLDEKLDLIPGVDIDLPRLSYVAVSGSGIGAHSGRVRAGGLATGGMVPGWSPNDRADNIPAMLTAGEYVLPVRATQALRRRFGGGFLESLRQGLPGYASGGMVGRRMGGNLGDVIDMGGDFLMRLFMGPGKFLKGLLSRALGGLSDSLPLKAMLGAGAHAMGQFGEWVKDKLFGGMSAQGQAVPVGPSLGGWQGIWSLVKSMFPDAVLTSAVRDSTVAGYGTKSLHASGRAIDFVTRDMVGATRILSMLRRWTELIHTPAGMFQQYLGRAFANFLPITKANHDDHVHAALADGGPVKPLLFDSGGYLPPGRSLVVNRTGRPEPLMRMDKGMAITGAVRLVGDGILELADARIARAEDARGFYERTR